VNKERSPERKPKEQSANAGNPWGMPGMYMAGAGGQPAGGYMPTPGFFPFAAPPNPAGGAPYMFPWAFANAPAAGAVSPPAASKEKSKEGGRGRSERRKGSQTTQRRDKPDPARTKTHFKCCFHENDEHKSLDCPLTPKEREDNLHKNQKCFNCGRKGHKSGDCGATMCLNCKLYGKRSRHHTAICHTPHHPMLRKSKADREKLGFKIPTLPALAGRKKSDASGSHESPSKKAKMSKAAILMASCPCMPISLPSDPDMYESFMMFPIFEGEEDAQDSDETEADYNHEDAGETTRSSGEEDSSD
jgi:hypothetical protein